MDFLLSLFALNYILVLVPVLLGVAFFTLLERKVLSLIGLRVGPNKVSFSGFLQPLGDAVKLSGKQINTLSNFSYFFYYVSSSMIILGSFLFWGIYFTDPKVYSLKFAFLFFILVLSFNSLSSVFVGWSSFGKYSLIGSLRTVAQLISYEASLIMCLFFLFFLNSSFSAYSQMNLSFSYLFLGVPFCVYVWTPSFLAELNRTPYDFSEGESELVSGFNTEYGSKSFTLIFLAEYSSMIFFCLVSALFFFSPMVSFFSMFYLFFLIWIRAVLPRFRFDKLMHLSWKFLIPFMTLFFLFFYMTL